MLWVLMESAEGGDLEGALADRRRAAFGREQLQAWMEQLTAGVRDCHRCAVAHLDLKPSNVVLTRDFQIKITE
jgi:serine/threonine protein kinase